MQVERNLLVIKQIHLRNSRWQFGDESKQNICVEGWEKDVTATEISLASARNI